MRGRTKELGRKFASGHHAICMTKGGDCDFKKHFMRLEGGRSWNLVDYIWCVELLTDHSTTANEGNAAEERVQKSCHYTSTIWTAVIPLGIPSNAILNTVADEKFSFGD
jgi:hypothetical protein